ncbi:hypothetical protein C1645_779877 [Glomus cerebriforme]|uniref:Ubiquitin-like domain-containing protein n=1 Tax=Glomus cerebriforme TaxID=658196 RepID=A0A397SK07_9GLOM|nr:hypothetical protein C1645_779877 [Glomus cerebriforme]
MNENKILLLLCISICSSFLGLYVFIEIEQWSQYKEYNKPPFKIPPQHSHSHNKKLPFNSAVAVTSALTSITNSPVITYFEYLSREENDTRLYEELDFQIFYKAYLSGGILNNNNKHHHHHDDDNITFDVHIESLTGIKSIIKNLNSKTTVQELKERILENGIVSDTISQRLVFNGQRLINTSELRTYNISQDNVIYLDIRQREGSIYSIKYLNSDFLNSKSYLQSLENHHKHHRCEWKRIFLTTKGKNHYINRFWPTSYHGTSTRNARRFADDGLIHSKDYKFNFSHGIFTTPDIDLASSFAQSFVYNGSKYLVLLQNRVNPKTLVKLPFKKGGNNYWVSPSIDDVKPYCLLIKKIGYCK